MTYVICRRLDECPRPEIQHSDGSVRSIPNNEPVSAEVFRGSRVEIVSKPDDLTDTTPHGVLRKTSRSYQFIPQCPLHEVIPHPASVSCQRIPSFSQKSLARMPSTFVQRLVDFTTFLRSSMCVLPRVSRLKHSAVKGDGKALIVPGTGRALI